MSGLAPIWLTVVQCVLAGIVIGLCVLHWAWWRGPLRRAGMAWSIAWSFALALLCLSNGLLTAVTPGAGVEPLHFLRFCLLATAVVLSLPAVHAWTQGPPVAAVALLTGAWYAAVAVLWLSTDLVFAHSFVEGLPVYGPAAPSVHLLPLIGVGAYVLRAVRRRALDRARLVMATAGAASSALLVGSFVPPPTALSEVLRGVWVVPLVVGLHVMVAARIRTSQRVGVRHAAMRDALAEVANAALFLKEPEAILDRAREAATTVLGDSSIAGSVRPLGRSRFVTELYSADGRTTEQDDVVFLRDLAHLVSRAAERQALMGRLGRAAYTDSLTQLQNRHALDRSLTRALERANVERTQVGILFCDLDGFKQANDRHGHHWGDTLLVHTAQHLRDVVGEDALVARHGGDEFAVLIERTAGTRALLELARRVREEFDPPGQDALPLSITVGVALWRPEEPVDPSALVRDADLAMLEAKRARSGVAVFDGALRSRVTAETALRRDLEDGIGRGEIVAHFQPLTNTRTLEVVGLEVLARWEHRGVLRLPVEWLAFAEESGLIVEVGRQMFRAARVGMERFDLPVAVNVAARQLDEPDFVDQVVEAWGDSRWDRLTIEVTESALLHDAVHVRAALAALVDRGVRIALDDFGTGYNSLSRLAELPLHILKIDRTFVRDIRSPAGAAVLRAIIALAEAHGLEVVAEGVEGIDELSSLVGMGVVTAQGHMLGRPAATVPVRGEDLLASHLRQRGREHAAAPRWSHARPPVPAVG